MKNRIICVIALLLCISMNVSAQSKHNLIFSASPYGHLHMNMKMEDEKYKYDYKNFLNGSIQYENSHHGIASLTELSYFRADFEKMDPKKVSTTYFNPNCTENLFGAFLTQYLGVVINPNGAVQVPFYLGLGADYLNNGDFLHHFTGTLAGKARIKIYFGKLGVYAGGSARAGFGVKEGSEHQGYHILTTLWNIDCGFILGL